MGTIRSARCFRRVAQGFQAICWIVTLAAGLSAPTRAWDSGRAEFEIKVNDELTIPYRIFAVFAVPGERVRFSSAGAVARSDHGAIRQVRPGVWEWQAPSMPGTTQLEFHSHGDVIRINAVTLHPSDEAAEGALQSFQIGNYPAPLEDRPTYAAPDGFIEFSDPGAPLQLSPHFRIAQFPSKQSDEFPKYLVLRESLLIKLEVLLERVNELGIQADTFTVMSGFRTPAYNHAIGNVRHSRHIYGGAADIFIDQSPRDGLMDDLNDDGVLDFGDAQFLYQIADELFAADELSELRGGIGVYRSTAAHGPFIHIDARGERARWGLIP